ncbi:uncharacterized protein BP01DRAFT_421593 [Aspergillus saccharolyticus JOP 1030-1]|uniref:Uncharacterized protein n=1 Tax=Aspergillus saccharolyticus JOP 1030-1 TaxID=1450539 RepID=A0A318ZK31_9EURO|nr:hypothetical protein BP01DRAFT_421593 [Aspergillus saccharolyticus JOP 1030-1]PYH47909.1 hypothetical protein BP01DRAFT_421593 [Aspergillus saccharolyticus JOP 1030-1]
MSNNDFQDLPSTRVSAAPASTAFSASLTESNLSIHEEQSERVSPLTCSFQQALSEPTVPSWIDTLIAEERIHAYHSQLGSSLCELPLLANHETKLDTEQQLAQAQGPYASSAKQPSTAQPAAGPDNHDQVPISLKLFENMGSLGQGSIRHERPLERFLTPGYSDPCFYTKPALAQIGVKLGSMEDKEKRKQLARENVELAVSRRVDSSP